MDLWASTAFLEPPEGYSGIRSTENTESRATANMTARKKQKIIIPSSWTTYEELEAIERSEERNTTRPKQLPLEAIHVADQVFQWRLEGENLFADRGHIKELVRVLGGQEEPLAPITITPIGSKFYVVDGHHRLAAYHSAGWRRRVPVEILDAPLKVAWLEALRRNIRDKLPMTVSAKYEAAWHLNQVKTPEGRYAYSKATIHKMTTVSDGLIGKMRKVLEEHGEEVSHKQWRQVKHLQWGRQDQEFDVDDWKEGKAKEIAEKLMASVSTNLVHNPDILARALEIISPNLPAALISEWLSVAYDLVEERREELEGCEF